jgi:iron complex transport system permease protein
LESAGNPATKAASNAATRAPTERAPGAARAWLALGALALAALALALATGTHGLAPSQLWTAIAGGDDGFAAEVILRLRLPRALAAFAVGALLALSGALMQVLLRNPLADPYVLGVSGGASVAALVALWAGAGAAALAGAAWTGAGVSVALLFALARRELAARQTMEALGAPSRLLLIGVMLAAGWSAIVTLILSAAPDRELRGMLFWLIGEFSGAEPWLPALVALALALIAVQGIARELNVMLGGEALAQALGVRVARIRTFACIIAAAATAFAVTTAGAIGFVGLVIPHAVRSVLGNDQRVLLPASALAGGALLVVADTLARSVVAPQHPVGAITALLGVPAFMLLLGRRARR